MKELIFIGGYAQSKKLDHKVVRALEEKGYSVANFTLSEFYKLENKNEILKDKNVVTHSMGLVLVPAEATISKLIAVNPPEPAKMLSALRKVSSGSRFDKGYGIIAHIKEIALHPIVHVKFWYINTQFSATEHLLEIANNNNSLTIQLLYSSKDEVIDTKKHDLTKLKSVGIKVIDTKSYHREIHSNPNAIFQKANI